MANWYLLEKSAALTELNSSQATGLPEAEAAQRLEKFGPNQLKEQAGHSPWAIIWEQLSSIMVIILIAAAVISYFLGDYPDAVVILIIIR